MKSVWKLFAVLLVGSALALVGCADDGDDGAQGPAGSSTGTVSGTVTNEITGTPIEGATVTVDGQTLTTDAAGTYSTDLSIGVYELTFEADDFETETASVSVVASATATEDAALTPTEPVIVTASVDGTPEPDADLTAEVTVETMDGSSVETYSWAVEDGPEGVSIAAADAATTQVSLPALTVYKDRYFHVVEENEALLDRNMVMGINPHDLEETALVVLEVTVTTDNGETYTEEVEIHTALPFKWTTGIENVATGIPVLVHGADKAEGETYSWSLSAPASSTAELQDADTQNPFFTPDETGAYVLSESDVDVLTITAGEWQGLITGQGEVDAETGVGLPESSCFPSCHGADSTVTAAFEDWRQSGHAHIFSTQLNTSTHYSTSCLTCHTVGFDTDADNSGFDDAEDYDAFLSAVGDGEGHFHADPDNWATTLADFPEVAQLGNIQCENCHGPNDSDLHMNGELMDSARVSISSDVCGSCHGEPLRHGRFQQWQRSGHANYELAIDEGTRGSCAKCHTGNGFIAWEALGFDPDESPDATWDVDDIHPQTCATCHDTHNVGTVSGDANDANLRVFGDTPVLAAGFVAEDVGFGAVCMTCHNSRRGLMNDLAVPLMTGSNAGRAPHGPTQTDILMGENAFFVATGARGKHSLLDDTCTTCHMERTDPPADLSYNLAGTNHAFAASEDICAQCHSSVVAEDVEADTEAEMAVLADALVVALETHLNTYLETTDVTLTGFEDEAGDPLPDVVIPAGSTVTVAHYADSHGRQAVDITYDGTVYEHQQLGTILVADVNIVEASEEGQVISKAGWNYLLVHNDGSEGIHNPTFSFQVLAAALNAIDFTDFTVVTPL